MEIADAIAILNRDAHRDFTEWEATALSVVGPDDAPLLSHFEAVAIAREYERIRRTDPRRNDLGD